MSGMLRNHQSEDRKAIEITVGQTSALMQQAWAGIVASGSATLEAAYFRMPFVLIYKVAWPTYVAARIVVNVDYLGMPNLLADKQVVPEFIQHEARADAIVKALQSLMEDGSLRDKMISEFDAIIGKLGGSGASYRAAEAILEEVRNERSADRPDEPETAASSTRQ
jgi:lipid-A-disaccharide synthase